MLQLERGVASQRVPTQVAGEMIFKMAQPSQPTVEVGGSARIKVVAGKATSVDVLNIPEAGQAGSALELWLHLLWPYLLWLSYLLWPYLLWPCLLWQAGSAFELVCLARDPFGNIDESFEKEVTIDYDGQLPNGDRLTLPNDGVVNLKKGMARVRVGRGKQ